MGAGRPLPKLELTIEENNRLVEWARRRTTAQALALGMMTAAAWRLRSSIRFNQLFCFASQLLTPACSPTAAYSRINLGQ